MNFDEKLAIDELNKIINKLDHDLVKHPMFKERFLDGYKWIAYMLTYNNGNLQGLKIGVGFSNDGKKVNIFNMDDKRIYKVEISLARVWECDAGLKCSFIYRKKCIGDDPKYPMFGKSWVDIEDITNYYDQGGIEMSRSEFYGWRIPFYGAFLTLDDVYGPKCFLNLLPTLSNCYCYDSCVMYREPDNLGLIKYVKEVKKSNDSAKRELIECIASRVSESPATIYFDLRNPDFYSLEEGHLHSSYSKHSEMSGGKFGELAKLVYIEGLQQYIKFRGDSDPYKDTITRHLLEVTKGYDKKGSFTKK